MSDSRDTVREVRTLVTRDTVRTVETLTLWLRPDSVIDSGRLQRTTTAVSVTRRSDTADRSSATAETECRDTTATARTTQTTVKIKKSGVAWIWVFAFFAAIGIAIIAGRNLIRH